MRQSSSTTSAAPPSSKYARASRPLPRLVTWYPSSTRFKPSNSRNKSSSSIRSRCGIGAVDLATSSGSKIPQTILTCGRVDSGAFESVVQCPHPTGAQIKIKEQVELTGRAPVSPHRSRRLLGSLDRGPEQVGCRRLVQPDQLLYLRGRGKDYLGWRSYRRGGAGPGRFWRDHRQSLIVGIGGRAFGRRAFGRLGRGRLAHRVWYDVRRDFSRGLLRWLNGHRHRRRCGWLLGTRKRHTRSEAEQSQIEKQTRPA